MQLPTGAAVLFRNFEAVNLTSVRLPVFGTDALNAITPRGGGRSASVNAGPVIFNCSVFATTSIFDVA
jgi:hypothetical protein